MHKPRYLLTAACALCAASVLANVKLATIFNSNMVLQRDMEVPVWGTAEPGEEVAVAFAGQNLKTTADDKGDWEVRLAPLAASTNGRPLVVTGKNTITNANVLVGDVWLCSGQSNMEMSFNWGVTEGAS
ncbi:MAG: sialate O-acetylesterase, partial [Lentisphaerae bacterium]|nr:sialate O-acetylesterase [Lentisphaerota bacterium]